MNILEKIQAKRGQTSAPSTKSAIAEKLAAAKQQAKEEVSSSMTTDFQTLMEVCKKGFQVGKKIKTYKGSVLTLLFMEIDNEIKSSGFEDFKTLKDSLNLSGQKQSFFDTVISRYDEEGFLQLLESFQIWNDGVEVEEEQPQTKKTTATKKTATKKTTASASEEFTNFLTAEAVKELQLATSPMVAGHITTVVAKNKVPQKAEVAYVFSDKTGKRYVGVADLLVEDVLADQRPEMKPGAQVTGHLSGLGSGKYKLINNQVVASDNAITGMKDTMLNLQTSADVMRVPFSNFALKAAQVYGFQLSGITPEQAIQSATKAYGYDGILPIVSTEEGITVLLYKANTVKEDK